jgi:hypothetical protein
VAFTDLISLLLGTASNTLNDTVTNALSSTLSNDVIVSGDETTDSTQNQGAPSTATPDQIAGALIRFMSRGKGQSTLKKGTSDSKPDSKPNLKLDSKPDFNMSPADNRSGLNPSALTLMGILQSAAPASVLVPRSPNPQSALPGAKTAANSLGPEGPDATLAGPATGAKTLLPGTTAPPNSKAPVAFEMHLTPVSEQAEIPSPPGDPQALADPSTLLTQTQTTTPAAQPASTHLSQSAAAELPEVSATPAPGTPSASPTPSTPSCQFSVSAGQNQADQNQAAKYQPEKDQGDTGGQARPRDEAPPKTSPAASGAPGDSSTQTNALQVVVHTPAPAQAAPGSPAGAPINTKSPAPTKTMDPASTPLADIKDTSAAPPVRSGETQQIDVRITQPQAPPVDLQVAQRSGQIQVVVRTGDPVLETALRQDLGTLVHSLERSGFHTEAFVPVGAASASESRGMNAQADPRQAHPDFSGNGSSGQNGGHKGGRGSGGNARGDDSSEPQQSEVWNNPLEEEEQS